MPWTHSRVHTEIVLSRTVWKNLTVLHSHVVYIVKVFEHYQV
uniref:Uncharacterized protein n=1 Tax=Anguilla anguilla TaxID=7936 RepID=A0A0E9R6R8_ANGAN